MRKSAPALFRTLVPVGLMLALIADQAFAGTTGKLNGLVKDQKGGVLPGANILIEGTGRGAITDASGYFFIVSVDPGLYRVTASIIGYEKQTQTDVQVQADFTTEVRFQLQETAVQMGEVVVQAERPPVEPDKTTSKYVVSAQDIQNIPVVRSTQGLIELQGGVSLDGEVSFRAGDPGDVAYYVDGVKLVNNDASGYRQFRNVNRSAIQEMVVITGGMEAEYGNAQGGIVSIVSRDGDARVHGYVDYQFIPAGRKHWGPSVYDSAIHRGNARWNDPAWVAETVTLPDGRVLPAHRRLDYDRQIGHWVENNLSGPLSRNVTFFLSAQWQRLARQFPGPSLVDPSNLSTTFKITFAASPNLKVRVGGLFQRAEGFNPEGFVEGPVEGERLDLRSNGKNLFLVDPNSAGRRIDREQLAYVSLTHSLSPRMFYELRLSYSQSTRDTSDLRANIVTADPIKDRGGYYILYRPAADFEMRDQKRYIVKADLSSQATRGHFLKTGFEFTQYDSWWVRYWSNGSSHRQVQWFSRSYEDISLFPGKSNKGVTPRQLGVYLQDKMEFEGMILNAGLRFDLLDPGARVKDMQVYQGAPMYSSMTRMRDMPDLKGPARHAWSPRIGVSHPITASSIVRFFYGKFYQLPTFQDMFGYGWGSQQATDNDLNKNGQIDAAEKWNGLGLTSGAGGAGAVGLNNPYLPWEEATNFEVGLDWNFTSDYILGLTSYYKSTGNQISTSNQIVNGSFWWRDPKTGLTNAGSGPAPGGYEDVRGLELNIRKKFSKMFSFNLSYNLQWAEAGRNSMPRRDAQPDSMFVANGHYWTEFNVDPATGREVPVDLRTQAIRERQDPDYYIRLYGGNAQARWREQVGLMETTGRSWSEAKEYGKYNFDGKGASVYVIHNQVGEERVPQDRDQRAFGSLTILFASPPGFGPAGGKVLGDIRANLIYRMFAGRPFIYIQPTGGNTPPRKYGPMHTRVDLSAEKQFRREGRLSLTLAVEVLNLFNQRDKTVGMASGASQTSSFNADRYMRYGITGPAPNDPEFVQYGNVYELTDFFDFPREVRFGVRIRW